MATRACPCCGAEIRAAVGDPADLTRDMDEVVRVLSEYDAERCVKDE